VCVTVSAVLVLCVAASLYRGFGVVWSSGPPGAGSIRTFGSWGGRLGWNRFDLAPPGAAPVPLQFWSRPANGGGWSPAPPASVIGRRTVRLPYWIPVLLLAIPAAWLAGGAYRAGLRKKRGLCRGCGYSLRGLGDGEVVCPECGETRRRAANRGRPA
jgi:hypothetical protein